MMELTNIFPKPMRITLISLDNWGFNNHIVTSLEEKGHLVHHINFNTFTYKYPNFFYKIYNFILKAFFKTNLKTLYYGKEIIQRLNEIGETQDIILTVKGDFIDRKSILKFKQFTKKSIGFFNDNTYRCPKIIRVIPSFDEVYSFEKQDCERYNLKFAPNWIYNSNITIHTQNSIKYEVFNIISMDQRIPILSRIASDLVSKKINYKFIIYDKKNKGKDKNLEYISKHVPLSEVNEYINNSRVMLDINRRSQLGLTFRVFESMGLQKKLITTNLDIKNYDFYNPNNILIIDENKPNIPIDFFDNEYEEIPREILEKYTLDGWVERVLLKENT
ncbi:hypothetical protein [Flavobacterium sp. ZB4R12]|uniref:hypothetical protein n=1 Tax=Flavobacterium sp. ZB4R12 TaxID=3398732 RepID=UPI003AAF9FCE